MEDNAQTLLARLEERVIALDSRLKETIDTSTSTLLHLLEEREKRFLEAVHKEETNREQSIQALAQRMNDALSASDKAVLKAEEAQRDYNKRSNEFRGQLDDQQKTLLPRAEYNTAHIALDDKFVSIQKSYDGQLVRLTENFESKITAMQGALEEKIKTVQVSFEKTTDRNLADIVSLRESRSEVSGRRVGNNELVALLVGVALVLATLFLAFGPVVLHK